MKVSLCAPVFSSPSSTSSQAYVCLTKSSPPGPPLCSLTEPPTFPALRVPHSSPKWQKNSPGEECEQVVSMLRYRVAMATAFRLWLHSLVMSSSDAGPTPAPPGVTGAKGSKLKTCKVEEWTGTLRRWNLNKVPWSEIWIKSSSLCL